MNPTPAAIEPEDYRRLVGFKLLLLAILGAAAYLNSLYGASQIGNQYVISPGNSLAAWLSPTRTADWSMALNYAIARNSTWTYHLLNIVLHALAALALYGVVCRTLIRQHARPRLQEAAPWLAFLIALLWLAHPLNTETVDYLLRRGNLLAGLLTFVTLYCVIRGADGGRGWLWYGLAIAACFLAVGSALEAAAVPPLVLLYDRIYLADSWRDLWRRRAGLYVGLAACWAAFAASVVFVGYNPQAVGFAIPGVPPLAYALAQPGVILHDLGLIFYPLGVCFDYSDWPLEQPAAAYVAPFVVVGALLALTVWALFRRPKAGFLGAWFFLTLAPTSSFIPQAEAAGDYRMYVPLAAVTVLVVLAGFALVRWAGERAPWAAYAAVVLALLAVGALGFTTFLRNTDYDDPATIWEDVIAKRPDNVRAQFQLSQIGDGLELYRRTLLPNDLNKAEIALHRAEEMYRAVARAPRDQAQSALWFNEFGYRLWTDKSPAEAASFFQEAVRLQPETAKYHFNLALALLDKGDKEGAESERQEGLKRDPDWPGTARDQAWKKATDADPRRRNMSQAVFLARQACQGGGENRPEALDALAAAYAAAGRFEEAMATAEQARQLADVEHDDGLSHEIQQRFTLYKDRQPFIQKPAAH